MATPTSIPTTQLPQVNLGPTMGAALVGVVFAAVFLGITIMQGIFYYRTYPKDPLRLKLMVAGLLILDSLSLALVTHGVYTYLVIDFDNIAAVATLVWSIASEPLVSGLVALIVHVFMAYRIITLDRRWWPSALFVVVGAMFTFSIAIVAVTISETSISSLSLLTKQRWTSYAAEISTSVVDISIAASITYLLHTKRGFAQTDRMINKITMYVIMNGLITSTLSVSILITYLLSPTDFYFQMINFSTSKAYTNTLLATLNSRQYISQPALSTKGSVLQFKAAPPSMLSDALKESTSGTTSQDVIALGSQPRPSFMSKATDPTWA